MRHFHVRLAENENKTGSRFDESSLNIQRNESRIDDHKSVIRGILSVVMDRLKHPQREEELSGWQLNNSESSSSEIFVRLVACKEEPDDYCYTERRAGLFQC
jgi:hypothetical protein